MKVYKTIPIRLETNDAMWIHYKFFEKAKKAVCSFRNRILLEFRFDNDNSNDNLCEYRVFTEFTKKRTSSKMFKKLTEEQLESEFGNIEYDYIRSSGAVPSVIRYEILKRIKQIREQNPEYDILASAYTQGEAMDVLKTATMHSNDTEKYSITRPNNVRVIRSILRPVKLEDGKIEFRTSASKKHPLKAQVFNIKKESWEKIKDLVNDVVSYSFVERTSGNMKLCDIHLTFKTDKLNPLNPNNKDNKKRCGIDFGTDPLFAIYYDDGTTEKLTPQDGHPEFLRLHEKLNKIKSLIDDKLNKGMQKGSVQYRTLSNKRNDIYAKINKIIKTWINQTLSKILQSVHVVGIEELVPGSMNRHGGNYKKGMNREMGNVNMGYAYAKLIEMAPHYNVKIIKVDKNRTSIQCSKCGYTHKDNRKYKKFLCKKCGYNNHADLNAAHNIYNRMLVEMEAKLIIH